MRVVDLADRYQLTTQEALDLCLAAGVAAEDGSTELTGPEIQQWEVLAARQREWQQANAAAEAAARAERAAQREAARQRSSVITSTPPGPAAAEPAGGGATGVDAEGNFGPLPDAPWEGGGPPPALGTGAGAPLVERAAREGDAGAQITPYAPVSLALAAMSFLFPFVIALMAFGLAAIAKKRIRESNGEVTGERLATAAQVLAVVAMVAWVALLGWALWGDYQSRSEATRIADLQVDTELLAWHELTPGTCVRVPHADIPVKRWQAVDCASPHEGEVISTHKVARPAGDAYPGMGSFTPLARDLCVIDFSTYIGRAHSESTVELATVFPTAANWTLEDDRTIACVVYLKDYDYINGTLKDSKR